MRLIAEQCFIVYFYTLERAKNVRSENIGRNFQAASKGLATFPMKVL